MSYFDFDISASGVMNKRRARPRLAELRRVLSEELPKILNGHKFYMGSWVQKAETIWSVGEYPETPPELLECHTAACAAGWGGILSPKLRRVGLRFRQNAIGRWMFAAGFSDLADIFGLSLDASWWLFSPDEYVVTEGEPARLEVLRRIDVLLGHANGEVAA